MRKRIFIGSSMASLPLAQAIATKLQGAGYSITLWTDAFLAGSTTVDQLVRLVDSHDYGVFVFGADDQLLVPNSTKPPVNVPRDNVIFECGMFLGRRGKQFALIAVPSTAFGEKFKIASDLRGVTLVTYDAQSWKEGNATEAVTGTWSAIRDAIATPSKSLAWMDGYWLSRFQYKSTSSESGAAKLIEQFNIEGVTAVGDTYMRGANTWTMSEGGPKTFRHEYTAKLHHGIVYGTWENLDGVHFGNFQLSVRKASTRMEGNWTGNGSTGKIEGGRWDWCKIENLTEQHVDEFAKLKTEWTSTRQTALAALIKPKLTKAISGPELMECLR